MNVQPIDSVEVNGKMYEVEYNQLVRSGSFMPKLEIIFLNKKLLEYPNKHESTLNHEIDHIKAYQKGSALKSAWVDIRDCWRWDVDPEYLLYQEATERKSTFALKSNLIFALLSLFFYPLVLYQALKNGSSIENKDYRRMITTYAISRYSLFTMFFILLYFDIINVIDDYSSFFLMLMILVASSEFKKLIIRTLKKRMKEVEGELKL